MERTKLLLLSFDRSCAVSEYTTYCMRHIATGVLICLISYLMMIVGLGIYADMFGKPKKSNFLDVWLIICGVLLVIRIVYLRFSYLIK